jgi:hypothetical protein
MSRPNAVDIPASHRSQEKRHKLRIPPFRDLRRKSFIGGFPLAGCLHFPTAESLPRCKHQGQHQRHVHEFTCQSLLARMFAVALKAHGPCVYELRQLLITQNYKLTRRLSLQRTSGRASLSQMSWKLAEVSARCVRARQCVGKSCHALSSLKTALGTLLWMKTHAVSVAGRR